eukprot:scaffold2778_cov168-Amphora_coffeaeformis.AAC.4
MPVSSIRAPTRLHSELTINQAGMTLCMTSWVKEAQSIKISKARDRPRIDRWISNLGIKRDGVRCVIRAPTLRYVPRVPKPLGLQGRRSGTDKDKETDARQFCGPLRAQTHKAEDINYHSNLQNGQRENTVKSSQKWPCTMGAVRSLALIAQEFVCNASMRGRKCPALCTER